MRLPARIPLSRLGLIVVGLGLSLTLWGRTWQDPPLGYQDTPLLPDGKWHVHDGLRPQPRAVDPGIASTAEKPGKAPSDAVVLFDGTGTTQWRDDQGNPTKWVVDEGGALICVPGSGMIYSRPEFGDCQLHVEFATPAAVRGTGQGRGNSGVFLFGRYEVQVLDSFQNPTYPDGQAGAIYGQLPPLVNVSRPPGAWQSYDILFTSPTFQKDGSLRTPAYETILHNGVVVQNHSEVLGPMRHRELTRYEPHGPRGPISLQDHGNPVRFRNIWVRELKGHDEP